MSLIINILLDFARDAQNIIVTGAAIITRTTPTLLLASLSVLGALVITSKVWTYLRVLASLYLAKGTNVGDLALRETGPSTDHEQLRYYGKKGSWVLVTGASDGIGKEYATQIAKQGYNLLLVSRTQSKLDILALEIESKGNNFFQPKVLTLAMDFAANKDSDYAKLEKMINDLDIAVLVNNVGLSHSIPVPFVLTPDQEIKDIIGINTLATLRVTKLVLPGMLRRKKGLVMTMGSFGGLTPTPLLATYSGSKAFLQHWSSALASELDGSGVDVQLTVSYLVTSAMSKIRRPTWTIPTAKDFVTQVLRRIGRKGGSTVYAYSSTPYPSHALMQWAMENTFGLGSQYLIDQNRGFHQQIRHRAARKAEREAKKAELEAQKS